jgi:hypothetical protein
MANNIGSVKVLHLETNKVRYYNFGTWAHHRRVEKESGKKLYKLLKTIPAARSNGKIQNTTTTATSRGIQEGQPRDLQQNIQPPKKKKRCNC